MPTTKQTLSLLAVIPDDLEDERGRFRDVVEDANLRWRHDGVAYEIRSVLVPGLHARGPAALAEAAVDEVDFVVVALWNRMGGPHEGVRAKLAAALDRWRGRGRPNVLAFQCTRPSYLLTREARAESDAVFELMELLGGQGKVVAFAEPEDFSIAARRALDHYARLHQEGAAPAAPAPASTEGEPPDVEKYLKDVLAKHGSIDLMGLTDDLKHAPTLRLEDAYISLSAPRRASAPARRSEEAALGREAPDRLQAIESALEGGAGDEGEGPSLSDAVRAALAAEGVDAAELDLAASSAVARLRDLEDERSSDDIRRVLSTEPLELQLRRWRHLLIEGNPGTGKTTTLKRVATALAYARQGRIDAAARLGFEPPYPLPIFAPLAAFARHAGDRLARHADCYDLDQWLTAYLVEHHGDWVTDGLARGRAVVLLDGLDEIMDDGLRLGAAHVLRAFIEAHRAECRFMVTSRPAGLTGEIRGLLEGAGLEHTQVAHLGAGERRRFVRAWYRAVVEDPTRAKESADDLVARFRGNAHLADLVDTPILLTAVAIVHLNGGRLPEHRAELYEQCVQALIGRRDQHRQVTSLLEHDRRLFVVSKLAFDHFRDAARPVEKSALVEDVSRQLRAQRDNRRKPAPTATECRVAADQLVDRSGLFIDRGDKHHPFRHLTFQEYLAGRWLGTEHDDPVAALATRLAEPAWREVVQLHLGYLAKDGPSPAKARLGPLIDKAAGVASAAARAIALGTLGRAIQDLAAYPRGEDFRAAAAGFIEPARVLIEDSSTPGSLPDRVAIADALGWLGDPRLSDDQRWVEIPAGRFWRGAAPGDDEASGSEKPAGWVTLTQPYFIQRWPVLVGEMAGFVAEGYAERCWWSEEGWAWRKKASAAEPAGWDEQRSYATRPVVGVSWWEAEAYAAWFDTHSPQQGLVIRLPTEAEWERAARGGEIDANPQRRYPWGDEWDEANALSGESDWSSSAPVGLFAKGHSPDGLWDMAGNVWEWCRDGWSYSYDQAEETNPEAREGADRVIRGGAWYDVPRNLRVSSRFGGDPGARNSDLGFRVVAAPGRLNP